MRALIVEEREKEREGNIVMERDEASEGKQ